MNLLVALATSLLLAAGPVSYVESRQAESGGFAEAGTAPDFQATAWAIIGLKAAGGSTDTLARGARYLEQHEAEARTATDVGLVAFASAAAGQRPERLLDRLRAMRPSQLTNATIWAILALRQAGEPVPPALVGSLRSVQRASGGWSWHAGGEADTNDTAAAIQALRAAGVGGRPIDRGVAFLRRHQNRDGGFELTGGRGSDAQSTAWAIQGLLAAGRAPGRAAFRYLARLRRPDGSYRYSARYVTTPLWVTSQVLPALARKSFPLP